MNCPRCDRQSKPAGGNLFYCKHCRMMHDDDPNEGGSYVCIDPQRAVADREEFELRQKARRSSKQKPNRRGGH